MPSDGYCGIAFSSRTFQRFGLLYSRTVGGKSSSISCFNGVFADSGGREDLKLPLLAEFNANLTVLLVLLVLPQVSTVLTWGSWSSRSRRVSKNLLSVKPYK